MAELTFTKTIAAPPAETFAACSDFASAPTRIRAIKRVEMLTPGPVRAGTRFKETRIMFGKEATEEFEVATFDPGRGYALRCDSCGVEWRYELTFRPVASGTQLDMKASFRPRSFFAKLMSPLAGMMMKACRKAFEQDLDDVARSLEGAKAKGAARA